MYYRHMVTWYSDVVVGGMLATALFGGALAAMLWWVLYRTRGCPGARTDPIRPPGASTRTPMPVGPADRLATPPPAHPAAPPGVPPGSANGGDAHAHPHR